jgi:hypothetical protein
MIGNKIESRIMIRNPYENSTAEARRGGSAGFLTCRIADILVGCVRNGFASLAFASVRRFENLRYGRLESLRYADVALLSSES